MVYCQNLKKVISIVVIAAFLFQFNTCLIAQSEDEIVSQFNKAKQRYISGQYIISKTRIERVITIIAEKNIDRKDILGKCYLLLGAIYEKESKPMLAEENYKRAKDEYGIIGMDEVELDSLEIYRKIIKGEGEEPSEKGTIEKEGNGGKKKRKKFPWLLVIGGVVVVGVVVYFLFLKPKKKYRLTVDRGEGVEGNPETNVYEYKKGTRVDYQYGTRNGYSSLEVRLDGNVADSSGTVVMDRDHTLTAAAAANVVRFVTDRDRVEVPEGGTATFAVSLSAQPQSEISATVSRTDGDSDISVLGNTTLTFTPSNWQTSQTVTLRADEDLDAENGEATIGIRASGIENKDITAVEIDNESLRFVTNRDNVLVEEGGSSDFKVRLSAAPSAAVAVDVRRISGDVNITVRTGSQTLTFTPSDWDEYQEVVVDASEDEDTENGSAVIRISAQDFQNKDITVQEIDNDALHFQTNTNSVSIEEGGTGTFQVRLSAAPSADVTATVSRVSGDSDITVQSGSSITFNAGNWSDYQTVTLAAAEDSDADNGEAIIRVSAANLQKDITAKEIDNDALNFTTDPDEVTVVEEGTAGFQVSLTAAPPAEVTVSVRRVSGDPDIRVVSGQNLTFSNSDWDTPQTVTLQADKDEDDADGQAVIAIEAEGIATKNITAYEDDNGTGSPPEISIKEPQNGDTIYEDVTVRVVAGDDLGIKKVEFYIDEQFMDSDTDYHYNYTWETREFSIGEHKIKAIVYDSIDQTDDDEITVTVGDNLPAVEISSPGATPLSGTVTIDVNASDYRGVQSIRFYMDDVELTPWNEGPQTQVNFGFQLDTTAYPNGTYTFKAVAVDTSTQESSPAEIQITIEN